MKESTPLKDLIYVLCRNDNSRIINTQSILYELFVIFPSNHLNLTCKDVASTTDELIDHIKKYLNELYISKLNNTKLETNYSYLHKCIFENMFNTVMDVKDRNFYAAQGCTSMLKISAEESGYSSYKDYVGNVNKAINNNKRKISHHWISEYLRCEGNYELMIYRIFWILQYYYVYYEHEIKCITNDDISAGEYKEYFSLPRNKKHFIITMLKQYCFDYSSIIDLLTIETMDLYTLSRIILDVTIAHYNYSIHTPISKEQLKVATAPISVTPIEVQWRQFITYVDAYGDKAFDRFHLLEKYADKNCLAANELGNLYFFGEQFVFGGNNYYTLIPDYEKAIAYYQLAIKNSNPPFAVACWSLGYILSSGCCSDETNRDEHMEMAKNYFEMAGKYPPAHNSLAKIYLNETEELYRKYLNGTTNCSYKEIIKKFILALEHASFASELDWFYGSNIIASFIMKHENDEMLLNDIKKEIHSFLPFEIVPHLQHACNFHNPWALNALALYYLKRNDKEHAKPLLEEAFKYNYNRAYYTAALYLYEEKNEKMEALKKSSTFNYPEASYKLATIYFEENDIETAEKYLERAKEQLLSLGTVNQALLNNINQLYIKIKLEE